MYTTIQTTTGLFPIDKLENVLMHEHIVLGYAGWFYDPRCAEFNHAAAEEKTLDRLKKLRDRGVNLVVDPCPIELGRNPGFMQEMSVKSGVQIMCSTGFDLEVRGCMSAFRNATAEELRDIYLYEIENGIGPEHVKPGIIKVATGFGYDLIQFGIVMTIGIQVGQLTPPVGINLFQVAGMQKESVASVIKGAIPFLLLLVVVWALVAFVPGITTIATTIFA